MKFFVTNKFSGSIDWQNSGRFRIHIYLQNNQFSGKIDTSFLNERLLDLYLENNNFEGPIDFRWLTSRVDAQIDTKVFCDDKIYTICHL